MAATYGRGSGNYFAGSGGYIPGDAATGHVLRYIDTFVDALEPYETPFVTTIGIGEEIDNPKPEWGQKYQLPHRVTLDSNMTDVATKLTVDTGEGAMLMQYLVLKIIDPTAGDEVVWIPTTSADWDSADVPDVTRAQGDTTAVAHTAPLTIEVIGIAEPNQVDHAEAPYAWGDFQYNRFQRFASRMTMDNLGIVTPNHEIKGDQLTARTEEESRRQKLLLEKAVIHGRRQTGNPDGSEPDMMGGIAQFLTTNVFNQSSAKLTVAAIEDATAEVWDRVETGMAQTMYVNMNTKRIIDRLVEPIRFTSSGPSTTEYDFRLTRLKLGTGDFNFVVSRHMPDGEIWGLNPKDLKIHPYKDSRWSVRSHETQGDHSRKSVHGVYTLLFPYEARAFRIHGFNTTIADYQMGA